MFRPSQILELIHYGFHQGQLPQSRLYWAQLCVSTFTIQPPLKHSSLLIYQAARSDHIKELNSARPKQPFYFLKPPSSILPPKSGPVLRPKGVDLHYEVELALILGKELRDLKSDDEEGAMNAIEGLIRPILFHSWRYRECG